MLDKLTKKIKNYVAKGNLNNKGYIFQLYITGILPNSVRAIANSRAIFEEYLEGRYTLEIIDIYQHPEIALTEDIIAIPVLVKRFPLPEERVVGDLSNIEEVLKGLHIVYTPPPLFDGEE